MSATYGFSKQEMLDELKSILMAEANIAGRFFNPRAATAMFGLPDDHGPIQFEELDISRLHITRVFSYLYDYVMNAEWDRFGNLIHPFDLRTDVSGFIKRAIAGAEFEMEFQEFAIGGEQYAAQEGKFCSHIAMAASARIQVTDPENEDYGIPLEELAELAHVDVRTVRNAAKELDIKDNVVYAGRASAWLLSRRMYRATRMTNSIDEIDKTTFKTVKELVIYIAERCVDRGIDDAGFKAQIGWDLDDLIPEERADDTPDEIKKIGGLLHAYSYFSRTRIDWAMLDQETWKKLARMIEVDWIWLYARLLKTAEVDYSCATRCWYQNTIWDLWDAHKARQIGKKILVPVASDGTHFHAGLQRRNGYLIGGKQDKHYVSDFHAALAELRNMPHAYWHRPKPTTGLWGVVKALSWKEMPEEQVLNGQAHQVEE